jgi:hypothetical protein
VVGSQLGKLKKVTVDEFKGMLLVSIREFYTDKSSGEEKPGKKGTDNNGPNSHPSWSYRGLIKLHFHTQQVFH